MAEIEEQTRRGRRRGRGGIRLTAVLAVALAAAFGAWLLLREDDDEAATQTNPAPAPVEAISADGLRALARTLDYPIYWAGPRAGTMYELSRTSDGREYIRYLPRDAEIGDPSPRYLTVGTYAVPGALAATRSAGEAPGGVSRPLAGGGLAVYNTARPSSVYVSFPGVDRQIEVFHPSPQRALQLVTSGAIVPIAPPSRPQAATPADLRVAQVAAGHPVYWIGRRANVTYELTQLPDGRTYVRYLPRGVKVGDPRARFTTVGTYPLDDALAALRTAAQGPGARSFEPRGGGLAYYHRDTPRSVYFARPGQDYEVEVYALSPAVARSLVRSGGVRPVG